MANLKLVRPDIIKILELEHELKQPGLSKADEADKTRKILDLTDNLQFPNDASIEPMSLLEIKKVKEELAPEVKSLIAAKAAAIQANHKKPVFSWNKRSVSEEKLPADKVMDPNRRHSDPLPSTNNDSPRRRLFGLVKSSNT